MLLVEQDTLKNPINKKILELDINAGNSKKYQVETIYNSVYYANKEESYLAGL